ncbi:MAG: hypothetical protein ACON5H_01960 [Akkermansiaceae bacterium]
MKLSQSLLFSLSALTATAGEISSASIAQSSCFCGRPDALAPIGIMGDHTHGKGEFMVSARTMFMRMEQNYIGNSIVTDLQAQQAGPFGVIPTKMDMQMHMFGAMYGLTENITLMAMIHYVEMSMDHDFGPGLGMGSFHTTSSGWGDASLGMIGNIWSNQSSLLTVGMNILLPTAGIDERDLIPPAGGVRRLPYPMQLGHGSWGISPSLTLTKHLPSWSYGLQAKAHILLDENSAGYRLGNRSETSAWIAAPLSPNIAASLRLTYSNWGDISGRDSQIAMLPVPTARENLRSGERIDIYAGLSYAFPQTHARLGLEGGKTVWQELDGPQLGNDYTVQLGLTYSW